MEVKKIPATYSKQDVKKHLIKTLGNLIFTENNYNYAYGLLDMAFRCSIIDFEEYSKFEKKLASERKNVQEANKKFKHRLLISLLIKFLGIGIIVFTVLYMLKQL